MNFSSFLASLVILAQVATIVVLAAYVLFRTTRKNNGLVMFVHRNALGISFLFSAVAVIGSLFYSDILGLPPCNLCWILRIFVFPQVLLIGMALWRNERTILPYALILSVVGFVIAGYQSLLQAGATPDLVPCTVGGYGIDCSIVQSLEFGYITIPLMAATAFAMLLLTQWIGSDRRIDAAH